MITSDADLPFDDLRLAIWEFDPVEPLEERLKAFAWKFISTPHLARARAFGWTDVELFGMANARGSVAARQLARLGLIPAIGLSSFVHRSFAVLRDGAVTETAGGARHRHGRGPTMPAVVFWARNPALTNQRGFC